MIAGEPAPCGQVVDHTRDNSLLADSEVHLA